LNLFCFTRNCCLARMKNFVLSTGCLLPSIIAFKWS
jgi:hypothetical protein